MPQTTMGNSYNGGMPGGEEKANRGDSFSRFIERLELRCRTDTGIRWLVASVRLWGIRFSIHFGFATLILGSLLFPVMVFLTWLPELGSRTAEAVISVMVAIGIAAVVCKIAVEMWRQFRSYFHRG